LEILEKNKIWRENNFWREIGVLAEVGVFSVLAGVLSVFSFGGSFDTLQHVRYFYGYLGKREENV